jgi:hypothetical protein
MKNKKMFKLLMKELKHKIEENILLRSIIEDLRNGKTNDTNISGDISYKEFSKKDFISKKDSKEEKPFTLEDFINQRTLLQKVNDILSSKFEVKNYIDTDVNGTTAIVSYFEYNGNTFFVQKINNNIIIRTFNIILLNNQLDFQITLFEKNNKIYYYWYNIDNSIEFTKDLLEQLFSIPKNDILDPITNPYNYPTNPPYDNIYMD